VSNETNQIEQDLERTRARLDATIGALQDKMSPGQLVDQALDYFRTSGGADFGRNLKDNVQNNPIPVALVGIGLAWLMMGGNRRAEPSRAYAHESSEIGWEDDEPLTEEERRLFDRANNAALNVQRTDSDTHETFQERVYNAKASVLGITRNVGESLSGFASRIDHAMRRVGRGGRAAGSSIGRGIGSAAGAVGSAASSIGHGISSAASGLSHGVSSAASGTRHGVSSAASGARYGMTSAASGMRYGASRAGYGMSSTAHGMRRAGGSTFGFLADQPLLLGALGVSVGALIAAMLPSTRTEDQLMGEWRDDLVDRAQEAGGAMIRSGARVADDMMGAANEAAQREGLTPDQAHSAAESARAGVSDAAQRVRHVVDETINAGREAARREFSGSGTSGSSGSASAGSSTGSSSSSTSEYRSTSGSGSTGTGPASGGGTQEERDLGIGTSTAGEPGRAAVQPTIGTSPRVHGYDERSAG
jgi:hypothetical protein